MNFRLAVQFVLAGERAEAMAQSFPYVNRRLVYRFPHPVSLIVALIISAIGSQLLAITIVIVPVGNPGNPADVAYNEVAGFGAVRYSYNIGKYDVTAGQYTAFLNAVAATDPYGLYSMGMATGFAACGISRSGSAGHYTYSTTKNANFPVNYVNWGDAARFSNWLTNHQPTGAEGPGTTETGSYTLNGATSNEALLAITRSANADYVIPTEDEWHKAAYYNPSSRSYYYFPTQSNSQPSNVLSATGTNNANWNHNGYTDPQNYLTAVGAFAASPSAYGTFDQGGDVFQWTEATQRDGYGFLERVLRGGSFYDSIPSYMQADGFYRTSSTAEESAVGFRVAQVPTTVALPGDFNNDGVVNAADYITWRKGLGTTYTQAAYDVWRMHFGQTAGSGAALASVPEPTALVLMMFAAAGSCLLRRRAA